MDSEELNQWRAAGRIAAEALAHGKSLIKPGANMREVCDAVDNKIRELGAEPAWPTQIGNDHVAAHFTPDPGDDAVFDKEVVCMDVGAHLDGIVGDNAVTVDLSGEWTDLVKASKEALEQVSKMIGPGVTLSAIGKTIQDVIISYNLAPVRNLSGHGISQYVIHDSPSVPNHDTGSQEELEEGQIIAIEPFATNGKGMISEADQCNIFAMHDKKPVRSPFGRAVSEFIENNYGPLPFTTRWISKELGLGKTNFGLKELVKAGALTTHGPLVEVNKGMVSVQEWTFYIGEKTEVLTR